MNILWDNMLKAKTQIRIIARRAELVLEPEVKYGILTSFLLIGGFTGINALSMGGIFIFPMLYFLFLTPGIYYSLWRMSPTGGQRSIPYFDGLSRGFLTALTASFVYSVFISVYIANNRNALDFVNESSPFGLILEPFAAGLSLFFEGLAFGVTITFCLMQYFKKD
jgi:hypothetical protein